MKAHPIGAKIPQECGSFMTTSFQSSNPVMISRIPDFYRWFLGADVTFRYEVHKMWLQHLSWRNSRKHWVLKIQEHMYSLPRSEEHTSELQSLMRISYAVFCLKKK